MATLASWIEKHPNVCGGDACVRNTRITVWGLVESRRLGMSDEQILDNIKGLISADLEMAWDYYAAHTGEIDDAIRQNAEA
jgi:uncharacterized protein (DUF433 family)